MLRNAIRKTTFLVRCTANIVKYRSFHIYRSYGDRGEHGNEASTCAEHCRHWIGGFVDVRGRMDEQRAGRARRESGGLCGSGARSDQTGAGMVRDSAGE